MKQLLARIEQGRARVVVIGAGYVGLPLLVEFARAGFRATGYDRDAAKVRMLSEGVSYLGDVPSAELAPFVADGRLTATTDPSVLAEADAVIVCVPTPLNKTRDPDMRYIAEATEEIAAHQHPEMLIILESTTYPGTTREVLVPRLTRAGHVVGRDVFVAFSPERVDPGNERYGTRNTPKVLGGTTPACLTAATALYRRIIDTLVPVTSTDAAEMVKLLENTFRAVNIGLVNEIALMSRRLGVDVWEVIRAAGTKPFGFMPFFPGPGLGGHCIPIDPLYLSWRMRLLKYHARFIELADTVNSGMPEHVVERVQDALNGARKAVNGARVLLCGVAYKKNVGDHRESPAFDILHGLRRRGADVAYLDPYVPEVDEAGFAMRSLPFDTPFDLFDVVVIVTDHDAYDYARMLRESKLIVDTRDALRRFDSDRSKVIGL